MSKILSILGLMFLFVSSANAASTPPQSVNTVFQESLFQPFKQLFCVAFGLTCSLDTRSLAFCIAAFRESVGDYKNQYNHPHRLLAL